MADKIRIFSFENYFCKINGWVCDAQNQFHAEYVLSRLIVILHQFGAALSKKKSHETRREFKISLGKIEISTKTRTPTNPQARDAPPCTVGSSTFLWIWSFGKRHELRNPFGSAYFPQNWSFWLVFSRILRFMRRFIRLWKSHLDRITKTPEKSF